MAVKPILLLGEDSLYQTSIEIEKSEKKKAELIIRDLHDTILDFQKRKGFGRAIAAPQIGENYRIIYMNIENRSTAFINPVIEFPDNEIIELWDDCMSFPGLEVKVFRYLRCIIHYNDIDWQSHTVEYEGDLSELLQHEYDHLDGVLAVQKAADRHSLRYNKDKMKADLI